MPEHNDRKSHADEKLLHSLVGENKCTPSNEAILQMLSPKPTPKTPDTKEGDSP